MVDRKIEYMNRNISNNNTEVLARKPILLEFTVLLVAFLSLLVITTSNAVSAPTLDSIIEESEENSWDTLSVGSRMAMIGLEFQGVPYVAGTLERPQNEVCNVLFSELDCVTFMELALNLSRAIEKYGDPTAEELTDEVTFTRYREGELDGWSSRLHYTSEWIYDNVEKEVVEDITEELGGEKIDFALNFMSKNTKYYPKLIGLDGEDNLEVIEQIEDFINEEDFYYIPKNKVAEIESQLQTGDIIAITSKVPGLDYNHVGMVYIDENGVRRFLHASLGKKKVTLDRRLSDYLASVDKHTGITVLRPLPALGLEAEDDEGVQIYYED
jgi:hypothetical protein